MHFVLVARLHQRAPKVALQLQNYKTLHKPTLKQPQQHVYLVGADVELKAEAQKYTAQWLTSYSRRSYDTC